MYADRDRSGVTTKRRDDFNRMIQDARDGKIDMIITKSVSRFARNTVDSLSIVRELKEKGVEIYFEKENIYTMDSKGELLITIMSSLAQEESRSISENVTWGQRKRFADGKVSMPYKNFLGYEKGEDGLPRIVPAEAEVVRLIYKMFLQGRTYNGIKAHLEAVGIPSPAGKKVWSVSTIMSILRNEKYCGNAILQKTFCTDFLTKRMKVNEGEVPQYYVENSHPAIISPELFDIAQLEYERRAALGRQPSGVGCFSGKIVCGCCGNHYGSKHWHSGSKYARVVWQCNYKRSAAEICTTPHLNEADIKDAFVKAFNTALMDKEQLVEDYELILEFLTDTEAVDSEIAALQDECSVVLGMIRLLVEENATAAQDQAAYQQRYDKLAARFDTAKKQIDELNESTQSRRARRSQIQSFLEGLLEQATPLADWDEELWYNTVESVTANADGTLVFNFRDGSAVPVKI